MSFTLNDYLNDSLIEDNLLEFKILDDTWKIEIRYNEERKDDFIAKCGDNYVVGWKIGGYLSLNHFADMLGEMQSDALYSYYYVCENCEYISKDRFMICPKCEEEI